MNRQHTRGEAETPINTKAHSPSAAITEMRVIYSPSHLTPSKKKKKKQGTNTVQKADKGNCPWECKLAQSLWKAEWKFLEKTQNRSFK